MQFIRPPQASLPVAEFEEEEDDDSSKGDDRRQWPIQRAMSGLQAKADTEDGRRREELETSRGPASDQCGETDANDAQLQMVLEDEGQEEGLDTDGGLFSEVMWQKAIMVLPRQPYWWSTITCL